MTKEEYDKEILRLSKRLELLKLARSGSVDVQVVTVETYWVKRHKVRKHDRVYYRKRGVK